MNQTMEILLGISNETGIQINELLNMMSTFYIYNRLFDVVFLIIFITLMSIIGYKIFKYIYKKQEGEKYFEWEDLFFIGLIPNFIVFISLTFIMIIIEHCVLGMMFPKEMMINDLMSNLI